jgi:hypothetical protein
MVTEPDTNPLPPLIVEFVAWLTQNHMKVCVTGSTPLVKYIHNMVHANGIDNVSPQIARAYKYARNADIDIYLHDEEHVLGVDVTPTRFMASDISSLMRRSMEDTGISIVYDVISLSGPDHHDEDDIHDPHVLDLQLYRGWYNRHFMGISAMYNITINRGNDIPHNKIQLIFTDRRLPSDMNWNECVTSTFDIDICKGTLDVSDPSNPIVHFTDSALSNIKEGKFDYVIRPCLTFEHHKTRLIKYIRKGFHIKSFEFHPLCSDMYKDYVMQCFQYHFAYIYATDILCTAGVGTIAAMELAKGRVIPMLYRSKMQWWRKYHEALEHDIINMVQEGVGMIHRRYTPSVRNCRIFIRASLQVVAMKIIIRWTRKMIEKIIHKRVTRSDRNEDHYPMDL